MRQIHSVHLHDGDQIRCEHQLCEGQPQGYPVLMLEGSRGDIVIYPGALFDRLQAAVNAYAAAHRRPVPAEACTGGLVEIADLWQSLAAKADSAVDVDELITSMAESYEVRRDVP